MSINRPVSLRVLYHIICGSSSAPLSSEFVKQAQAVGLLCEYTGLKMPIVAVPCFMTGGGLDTHAAFPRSIRMLRRYGVQVLYHPETYPPKNEIPPAVILKELHRLCGVDESGEERYN
jgi:hypothetical protein